ncbi:MAG: VOC family protein [Acidobacteriota bacterium]
MKMHATAALALLFGMTMAGRAMQRNGQGVLADVDHLVYATPDLALGVDTLERLLGVRAAPGGQHPGLGTRNALIALGPSTYLEIIGPDPDQPKPAAARRFGIDELTAPRLTTWVAKGKDLDGLVARARGGGVALGDVTGGSRKRPDGVVLSWRYTDPAVVLADRLIPYVIDWGASPHPAATAAPGVTLIALRAEHPDAARVGKMFAQLGFDLPVRTGAKPALIATLDGRKGRVELSSRQP